MSGTGKTSLAYAMGQFIENDSVVVPIQPMWKERSDMIGYFNEFTKKFNETTLLRKIYEAGYREELYITILDEVNISRIEYYFAEFLSLLELPDENGRYLDVVSDVWEGDPLKFKDGKIKLPPNMWFVGTANNDDSTFAISDKVYDRAMVLNLDKKSSPFTAKRREGIRIPYSQWCALISEAQENYSLSEEAEQGIHKLDAFIIERFGISFGNRIMKQIKEYVPVMIACGGTEMGAIDDILARKVLRKLEQQSPTHIRNSADDLIAAIESSLGNSLTQCNNYIAHLKKIM
jgi:5-methylcytosine-specific restriction endonuclease McrBC GTP-binding regulatory subunit McrB